MIKIKCKRKPSTSLNVLVTEQSPMRRKHLEATFKENGYRKLPAKGIYHDEAGSWILLKRKKTTVMIQW